MIAYNYMFNNKSTQNLDRWTGTGNENKVRAFPPNVIFFSVYVSIIFSYETMFYTYIIGRRIIYHIRVQINVYINYEMWSNMIFFFN